MSHALETLAYYYLTYVLPYGSALTTIYRTLEAAFGPVVKQRAPRAAHMLEMIAAVTIDFLPGLKSAYKAVVGTPWPTLPAAGAQ